MTDRELEGRLRAWYRDAVDEAEVAPPTLRQDVAAIPRAVPGRPRWSRHTRGLTLLAAAVVIGGTAAAAGSGILRLPSFTPPRPVPSPAVAPTSTPADTSPAPAISPVRTPAHASRPGALIAFIRTTDKAGAKCYDPNPTCPVARIWVVGAGGSDAHELVKDGVDGQSGLAWSPDGARLVFSDGPSLYLTDVDGKSPAIADTGCVAPCTGDHDATFSTDGTKLVFVRDYRDADGYDGPAELATMDLESGQVVEIASTAPGGGSHPDLSPDGKQVVFSRYTGKGPKAAVFIVDADGQNLHQLTPAERRLGLADWSPDGERILLTSFDKSDPSVEGDFHQDVYTIRPDGTDLRQLTTDGISNRASWTPDGRILFARGVGFVPDGGSPGLWTMDADGRNAARLMPTPMTGDEWQWWVPAWQPVGGPSVAALPWSPQEATTVGPPPPTPAPTPTPALGPGFSWTGSMHIVSDGPLSGTATLLADGRVLVTGGCTTDVEVYDPSTGTFSPTGSLTAIRGGTTATLLGDGRVLIAGGYNCGDGGRESIWATAELYDPRTGTFTATGSMDAPRSSHTATLLADGRVLVVGGQTIEKSQGSGSITLASYRLAATGSSDILATAEIYDPATGTFSPTGSMRDFRHRFTATRLLDGRVMVTGGGGEGYPSRTSAEIYDPATGRFTPTGSMKHGRWLHTATLLQDGRVLITGGRSPDGADYASAELFDPGTGTFTTTGSMAVPRQEHTATLLPDGRVLITGGYEQKDASTPGQTLDATELYDPVTGGFTGTGSMGNDREGHSATLLPDGRVLITGGSAIGDEGTAAVTSAVLYEP